MPLRLRRGTDAERLTVVPLEGELVYTTDTKQIFVGDGTTSGGVGVTSLLSGGPLGSDIILNGYGINGTGNIDINGSATATAFNGDLSGSVFADNSSVLVDSVAGVLRGQLIGNVTGNTVGTHTGAVIGNTTGIHDGDIIGSVFSDDSSLLVDGVNSLITGNIATSNFKIGSATAPQLEIFNIDASILRIDTSIGKQIQLQTDRLNVGTINRSAQLRVTKLLDVSDQQASVYLTTYRNDEFGGRLDFLKTRGTGTLAHGAVVLNDTIGTIRYQADDGTFYTTGVAQITTAVDGAVSAGIVPGRITISTASASGTLLPALTIKSTQVVSINSGLELDNASCTLLVASTAQISRDFSFSRSRGTTVVPTVVSNNDHIYALRFRGHDGTAYRTSASIRGEVATGVTAGIVPGQIRIQTTNTAGSTLTAMLVNSDQSVTFNGTILANTVEGNFIGSVFADDSTVIVDAISGNINSNNLTVSGSAVVQGDVQASAFKGSVVGDDSTVIVDAINSTISVMGFIQFGSYTKAERDDLTAGNGMVLYNTTNNKFQGYQNSAWINLDDGSVDP